MTSVAARELTAAHRRAQLAIRAEAVRDVATLWAAFDLADIDRSWIAIAPGMEAIARDYGSQSARQAAGYYRAFRTAEGVPGTGTVRPASPPPAEGLRYSLGFYGRVVPRKLLAQGRPDAMAQALTHLSGGVGRHAMNVGRDTIIGSVQDDIRAQGFRRVTAAQPCEFCEMLAGRGAVYKSAATAGPNVRGSRNRRAGLPFTGEGDAKVHDHCMCSFEPVY